MSHTADQMSQKLSQHPKLSERMSRLFDIIDNKDGKTTRGDDAEACVVLELRELGREVLEEWGKEEETRCEEAIYDNGVTVYKKQKKNSPGIQRMETSF